MNESFPLLAMLVTATLVFVPIIAYSRWHATKHIVHYTCVPSRAQIMDKPRSIITTHININTYNIYVGEQNEEWVVIDPLGINLNKQLPESISHELFTEEVK